MTKEEKRRKAHLKQNLVTRDARMLLIAMAKRTTAQAAFDEWCKKLESWAARDPENGKRIRIAKDDIIAELNKKGKDEKARLAKELAKGKTAAVLNALK